MAQSNAKALYESPFKTKANYNINPEGRVTKCHMKPQPSKYFQLRNAKNERMQVILADRLTMAIKEKSQLDSIALCKPQSAFISTYNKPTMEWGAWLFHGENQTKHLHFYTEPDELTYESLGSTPFSKRAKASLHHNAHTIMHLQRVPRPLPRVFTNLDGINGTNCWPLMPP